MRVFFIDPSSVVSGAALTILGDPHFPPGLALGPKREVAESLRKIAQERDEARTQHEALMAALKYYADTFCEGWCKKNGGCFEDCSGCRAAAALRAVGIKSDEGQADAD
jgi:hypothetical protein